MQRETEAGREPEWERVRTSREDRWGRDWEETGSRRSGRGREGGCVHRETAISIKQTNKNFEKEIETDYGLYAFLYFPTEVKR